jgi:hypothetical protein
VSLEEFSGRVVNCDLERMQFDAVVVRVEVEK